MERSVPIRAVSRSIAVLKCINRHGSLPLMEIARHVNLPYPTTFRIIQTLVLEGLLECEPTRKHYRATQLVQTLSVGYRETGNLLLRTRPHMQALTRRINWPISLATHVGQTMMVRDSTHRETSLSFCNYEPGYTLPMLECASGHVYLAHIPDSDRLSLLGGLEAIDRRSHMLEMFKGEKLVRRIREDGYATCDRNPHSAVPGKTSSIAVPLFEGDRVAGALTLIFFSTAMSMAEALKRYVDELKSVGRSISLELRHDQITAQDSMVFPQPGHVRHRESGQKTMLN
ncbi:helix-turn-helix domain-containing protein [Roseateles sp. SL47]|uniref:helix-turn-helix domain-containing protein n=1 Tax=Roseateles sp. SL47 TaxID=2995138 RepID=UPI0022713DB9|nr:helix-turn-helix domain-containing protein [Roseateles sp. SL47]WAC71954.1 helix-turn-helix domain-containing protein [Roseateles sp. SL47]